jgi:ATP-dependent DNA helicase RecQ
MQGCGIIYCATTRSAQETAAWLNAWGIAADAYHGRRKKTDRARVQDAFMAGELRVITATNAFGLGVDKPDIRFVIHRDIPANLEAYYQEAGRAGRDGGFARCTLIYRPGDLGRAAFLAASGQLTRDEVVRGWAALRAKPSLTITELQVATRLGRGDVARLVETLEAAGLVRRSRWRVRLIVDDFDPDSISLEHEERRRAYERSRLEMMRGYAEERGCRHAYVLSYFGERQPREQCAHCDNDMRLTGARATTDAEPTQAELPFAPQDRVRHPGWGEGTVQRVVGQNVTVLFDSVGYKTLATDIVLEQNLLTAVQRGAWEPAA